MIFTVAEMTIICGLERLSLRIGSALVQLGENVIIVAVSPNPDRVREAAATGATFVEGRGADLPRLSAARLSCARCLVLTGLGCSDRRPDHRSPRNATRADAQPRGGGRSGQRRLLEAALTGRELNPRARIVSRLFDQELVRRAQEQLGIHACYSVSGLATPAFVAAALGDGVLSTIEAAGHTWLLGQLSVDAGSPFDGSPTAALEEPGALHVLAVRESNSESWRPTWPERLSGGNDVLIVCRRERWEPLCGVALRERRPPKPEAPGGA